MAEKACDGGWVLEVGDFAECASCGTRIRWDMRDDPFWGFQHCRDKPPAADARADVPRRHQVDAFTPAERAIYDAVRAVEAMPADVRLTDAVVLLQAARESVADFVDGIVTRRSVSTESNGTPDRDAIGEPTSNASGATTRV